MNCGN